MALLKCPECGAHVSEFAKECPNCGCPMSDISQENQVVDNWDKKKSKRTTYTQAYTQEELNRALEDAKAGRGGRQQRKPGQKRIVKNSESILAGRDKKPKKQSKDKNQEKNSGSTGTPGNFKASESEASESPGDFGNSESTKKRSGKEPKPKQKSSGKSLKIALIIVCALAAIGIVIFCVFAFSGDDKTKITEPSTDATQSQEEESYRNDQDGATQATERAPESSTQQPTQETRQTTKQTTRRRQTTRATTTAPTTQPQTEAPTQPSQDPASPIDNDA